MTCPELGKLALTTLLLDVNTHCGNVGVYLDERTICKPLLNKTYGKKRCTLLAWAALKGYVRCIQLLISHGTDPGTRCADGYTALHLDAASAGNTAIFKLLLGEKPQASP